MTKKQETRGRPRKTEQLEGITISIREVDESVWEKLTRFCRHRRMKKGPALSMLLEKGLSCQEQA